MLRAPTTEERVHLVRVARGQEYADLVVTNGLLINVNTREIYQTSIAVWRKWIAAVGDISGQVGSDTHVLDVGGRWLAPGLIDPHFHIESSMLMVTELARLLLPRGVTSITEDPHEIANVFGEPGITALLEEGQDLPLKVFLRVPGQVPGNPGLETSGASLDDAQIADLLHRPYTIALAGDLSPNLVLDADPGHLSRIGRAIDLGLTVNGEEPELPLCLLNSFVAGGPQDSHIAGSYDVLLNELRLGLNGIVNDMAFQFVDAELDLLIAAISSGQIDSRHVLLCADDVHPHVLVKRGAIDAAVRRVIERGLDPMVALQMATLNVAEHYHMNHLFGSLAPGCVADILVIDDLSTFHVQTVIADGEVVADSGVLTTSLPRRPYAEWTKSSVHISRMLVPADFIIPAPADRTDGEKVQVRVIYPGSPKDGRLLPGTSKAERRVVVTVRHGALTPDADADVVLAAVVDRHSGKARIGRSFVQGFRLGRGAVAQTINHDNHNLVVVGVNPSDMAVAANHVVGLGGGIGLALDGVIIGSLALPIAGLLSEDPAEKVAESFANLERKLLSVLGFTRETPEPFFLLQMFALAVIPDLGLTDYGIIDVMEKKVVDIEMS